MVVHPAAGNETGTLVQALLYHCESLGDAYQDEVRPGIVHRLDKDTSGVLIAAKHPQAQEFLARQFRKRSVSKKYYAVVKGALRAPAGQIEANIRRNPRHRKQFSTTETGGKAAVTRYRLVHRFGTAYSFVALEPHTGRTHQLRVHLQSIGSPILGDSVYSRVDAQFPEAPMMLHAYALSIIVPGSDTPRTFRAPLPEDFRAIMRGLSARFDG